MPKRRSRKLFRVADEVRNRKFLPQRTQRNNRGTLCGGSLQKTRERGKPLRPAGSRTHRPPYRLCLSVPPQIVRRQASYL